MALSNAESAILSAVMGGMPGGKFRIMPRPLPVQVDSREYKAAMNLQAHGLVRVDSDNPGPCNTVTVYSGIQWAEVLAKRESGE